MSKFILKHWCCLTSVEKLSGIFKFLFLNSVERDVLQHLDSSTYNQAAHFLSHSTPCNPCVPTARNAVISLEVIIFVTYTRATDMRVILCLPFCIILNVWLVYFRQKNIFYYRKQMLKGDTYERNGPICCLYSEVPENYWDCYNRRKDEANRFF